LGLEGALDPSCLGVVGAQTQVPWVLQTFLTEDTWVRRLDPRLMGPAWGPKTLESYVLT